MRRVQIFAIFAAGGRAPGIGILALCLAVFALGAGFGSRTAGGSDSYGYVSQADLWLTGRLWVDQPWAATFAWPDVDAVFAPLGYAPGTSPHTIVPTYPPGLPMLMAAFRAVGGSMALYLVVPLAGAAAVWLTWALARMALSEAGALAAALLFASSPAFLFHLLQPMSDVPATSAWLAALLLMVQPRARPVLAGLAAGAAVLIRPSLAPLAAVIAAVPLVHARGEVASPGDPRNRTDWRTAAQFATAVLPGVVIYAGLNAALYGGALRSGYGSLGELFSVHSAGGTLVHYVKQLIDTQTPFVALAPLGFFALGRAPLPAGDTRLLRFALAGTVCGVAGVYALYARFEEWTYLRFLLPAYPAIIVLSVAALQWIAGSKRVAVVLALAACLVVAAVTSRTAVRLGLFDIQWIESRYERVARNAARLTPPNAAILAMQHSGSLRYYASRMTVRYDLVAPGSLERTVNDLARAGYRPYILLEEWELGAFRSRFGATSQEGQLERFPIARLWPRPAVFLYDAQEMNPPRQHDAPR